MRGDWISVVLGAIAAGCGLYVRYRLGPDVPAALWGPIMFMTFGGLTIALVNLMPFINRKKETNMPKTIYKLDMPCPACGKEDGMRIIITGDEMKILCVICEDVGEDISEENLAECISALTRLASEEDGLTKDQVQTLVLETLEVPEFGE